MTRHTTCSLSFAAAIVALTQAQEPIPIPLPEPISTVVDNDISEADSAEGSILVESVEGSNRIPVTPAPEIEKPPTTIDSTKLALEPPLQDIDSTVSSSVDGLETKSSRETIEKSPADRQSRPSIDSPEARRPRRASSPTGQQTSSVTSGRASERASVNYPQRIVIQQRPPTVLGRPRATTFSETQSYRAVSPNAVRPATYEQNVRRPTDYRYAEPVTIPVEAVVIPSRRLVRYGYGPAMVAVTPLETGSPRGPAGQPPQPRPFVRGQPLRNFVRGLAPY